MKATSVEFKLMLKVEAFRIMDSVFTNELRKTAGMNCLYYELHLYCREKRQILNHWFKRENS